MISWLSGFGGGGGGCLGEWDDMRFNAWVL